ncbi:MAG TPA: UDP-2,3-diacylglucosamine diphosphatase LpxI [Candidatus Binatia bacterium]|nr:UDP-2,3-diacylglucosamine diphosphatase LpxI [Candidatus Binatia bacterium]
MRKLGLIAGNGRFPLIFAEQAKREGVELVTVAHRGETLAEIEHVVGDVTWVYVGELGKIIRTFQHAGVNEAVMVGGIKKIKLFSNFRPDLRGAAFLARVRSREDDQLLRGVAGELEKDGIRVLESTLFLSEIIPGEGPLTRRSPTIEEWKDIRLGFETAKEIGRLGIGQCVVVKRRVVVAVEAVEGTDAAIRRGGELGKDGFVAVKVSKPQQDLRFDVPAVGLDTIRMMRELKGAVLAVEAGKTILIEKDELIAEAERAGIAVVGVSEKLLEGKTRSA